MDAANGGRGGVGTGGLPWHDIGGRACAELRIPDIHGERCVHAIVEQALCRACVDACPHGAWLLDDEGLNLNTDRCDGCGLCAPACPQGAVQQERAVLHGHWNLHQVAAIACERSGVKPGPGMLPCLHTLGERELLRLQRSGVTQLISCRGDCAQCPRGGATAFATYLARVNGWLKPRRRARLSHVAIDPAQWQQVADSLSEAAAEGPSLSRRAFFRAGLETGSRMLGLDRDERKRFQPPGELLDGQGAGLPMPYVPAIDPRRCNACHACARLCPQGAIELVEEQDGGAYVLNPALCTGCGVCGDVCDQQAVSVGCGVAAGEERVPLQRSLCRACGAPYLQLAPVADEQALCRICSQNNHHRQLYQVY